MNFLEFLFPPSKYSIARERNVLLSLSGTKFSFNVRVSRDEMPANGDFYVPRCLTSIISDFVYIRDRSLSALVTPASSTGISTKFNRRSNTTQAYDI